MSAGPRRTRPMRPTLPTWLARDPRDYQIAALASFLLLGVTRLAFPVGAAQIAATVLGAQLAQWACTRATRARANGSLLGLAVPWDPKSAMVSSLSLCLLLRTTSPALAALAAALAVTSKFVARVRDKHLFNPANVAIVALL